jgi:hypothetical protein
VGQQPLAGPRWHTRANATVTWLLHERIPQPPHVRNALQHRVWQHRLIVGRQRRVAGASAEDQRRCGRPDGTQFGSRACVTVSTTGIISGL